MIPGMVDTHRHVWQGAIGGYTPQITGDGYGPAVLTGISLKHTPEDIYAGTLWGALQALDAGITTIGDWAHNNQSPATPTRTCVACANPGSAATSSTAVPARKRRPEPAPPARCPAYAR